MALVSLAWRSLRNRASSALLTLVAVAVSVALFLGVEKVRDGVRASFENTISGTDLIVGARSGQVNLLLYTVFRLGNATANVSWESYQEIAERPEIAWTVPMSLGDSHRGYRVLGTSGEYFVHYKYAGGRELAFEAGAPFTDIYEAVIGAEVADALDYTLGEEIILTHGLGGVGDMSDHKDRPFVIVGILERTGTPVDRTIHVSLESITAIHVGWESGVRNPLADTITDEMIRSFDLTPRDITAFLVGLKPEQRRAILNLRYQINTGRGEALQAVVPGEALRELWQVTGIVETALMAVSGFVIVVGLVSILVSILTSLNERRREMAILRAVGAGPGHVFFLLLLEAAILAFLGAVLGWALVYGLLNLLAPWIAATYGVVLYGLSPGLFDLYVIGGVTLAGIAMGLWPAVRAYRASLADGMTVKV
jgi:putative ABC transport system permease protein